MFGTTLHKAMIARFPLLIYALPISFFLIVGLCSCGLESDISDRDLRFLKLSPEERDYVERFNILIKDIRDTPKPGKDLEKYFHIYKSTSRLEDAKILIFAERHSHSVNQVWTAGLINRMIGPEDALLFEGNLAGKSVGDVAGLLGNNILSAREFEKTKLEDSYHARSLLKIWQKKFRSLYGKIIEFLPLDSLKLNRNKGFFWDDPDKDSATRNAAMVDTIKDARAKYNRVFVIAGALHVPHYDFAYGRALMNAAMETAFLAIPGARSFELNEAYYRYYTLNPQKDVGTTKVIFDYLKGQDFAVFIPKNFPDYAALKKYLPTNVK